MKIKKYKCKCEHDDFFFADKGNQKGIYCSYCGKWLKWADKDEQNLALKRTDDNVLDKKGMRDTSDVLTVSFDSGLNDESALCVSRKCGGEIILLKMEWGEQADILYRLLTEQMVKAEIKAEGEG